jgi:hypothetical protein
VKGDTLAAPVILAACSFGTIARKGTHSVIGVLCAVFAENLLEQHYEIAANMV